MGLLPCTMPQRTVVLVCCALARPPPATRALNDESTAAATSDAPAGGTVFPLRSYTAFDCATPRATSFDGNARSTFTRTIVLDPADSPKLSGFFASVEQKPAAPVPPFGP